MVRKDMQFRSNCQQPSLAAEYISQYDEGGTSYIPLDVVLSHVFLHLHWAEVLQSEPTPA